MSGLALKASACCMLSSVPLRRAKWLCDAGCDAHGIQGLRKVVPLEENCAIAACLLPIS